MYIGSTGPRGLHHLVWEIVDNSIDEALAGHCSEILVVVHPDNSVTVIDDGRGLPVGTMKKYGKSATEVILTTLHAGGKFDGQGYKVSGGLHGVGASVVNALSEWLEVEVKREGHVWSQRYERGFPKGKITKDRKLKKGEGTGTTISFMPDTEVFTETVELSFDTLSRRFRESAFLNKGLKIRLVDEREEDRDVTYQYEGGIRDFVAHINEAKDPVHKTVFYLEREEEVGDVEVGQALRAAVRGADQDQARQHRGQGPRRERDQPLSLRVLGGAARRGQGHSQQGLAGRQGAARRKDGEGEDPQGLPGELHAAGQARRLLLQGPRS
jgi:DNA gyrase subunit B